MRKTWHIEQARRLRCTTTSINTVRARYRADGPGHLRCCSTRDAAKFAQRRFGQSRIVLFSARIPTGGYVSAVLPTVAGKGSRTACPDGGGTDIAGPHRAAIRLLDRLLHHATTVVTSGQSYRMREAKTRIGGATRTN